MTHALPLKNHSLPISAGVLFQNPGFCYLTKKRSDNILSEDYIFIRRNCIGIVLLDTLNIGFGLYRVFLDGYFGYIHYGNIKVI